MLEKAKLQIAPADGHDPNFEVAAEARRCHREAQSGLLYLLTGGFSS